MIQIIGEMALEKKLEKLKEMQRVHYDSTTPMDDYFTGMYNGMEYAIAMLEDREANYKTVESTGQRSFTKDSPPVIEAKPTITTMDHVAAVHGIRQTNE
jgi:hypothetical protein